MASDRPEPTLINIFAVEAVEDCARAMAGTTKGIGNDMAGRKYKRICTYCDSTEHPSEDCECEDPDGGTQ